ARGPRDLRRSTCAAAVRRRQRLGAPDDVRGGDLRRRRRPLLRDRRPVHHDRHARPQQPLQGRGLGRPRLCGRLLRPGRRLHLPLLRQPVL
ncbi:MAG: hypothetical protein AVDCRST_MAG05-2244, partial [uncultured Rubrobacteraceae bacterium]